MLFVSATETISAYSVPTAVKLNRTLNIYGTYWSDSDVNAILCSFFVFDSSDNNALLTRYSDEYILSDGTFSSNGHVISEPLFKRGNSYYVTVKCGNASRTQLVSIEQKEDFFGVVPSDVLSDLQWWTNSENSFTIVMMLCLVLLSAALVYALYRTIFEGRL